MKTKIAIAAAGAALALPAAASAHVTLQPDSAPAGGFTRLDVRVPNERDDAATEKVEVKLPDGFIFVSYEPVEGWETEVRMERLDQPVEEFGEKFTEQVSTATWTATDPGAAIQPGEFRDFGLSVGLPSSAKEGDELTFPALQTYDSGEVVRWIGAPDAEEPAAVVTLTAPEEEGGHAAAATEDEAATVQATADDDDDGSTGLSVAALAIGGLGLVAGGVSLARTRR
jgi:periplasmic copper chaperone A